MNEPSAIWQVHNGCGRFDDGVKEKTAPGDSPKRGEHFRELMALHNLTDDDINFNTCADCGCKHTYRTRRCSECTDKWNKTRDANRLPKVQTS